MSDTFLKSKTIDIHEMMELEAKKSLEKQIISLHKQGYRKIIIIHGYIHGQVLMNMVQKKLRSKLIKKRQLDVFNRGQTTLILKDKR